jgi:hypothetical protein
VPAYFHRIDDTRFRPSDLVRGAWNPAEMHIAPALGLLTHAVERHHRQVQRDGMRAARMSFDILGTIPIDVIDIVVRVLRPGRTIELVEATLSHGARPAVIGRVWMMATRDTSALRGGAMAMMRHPKTMERWQPSDVWDGAFVGSIDILRREEAPGRGQAWLRPQLPLLDSEPVSLTARALGVLDVANGIAIRVPPTEAMYPNLDLTAHLASEPRGEWIGLDTAVTFGSDGVGLTHSIVHDETGPIGAVDQILTVRPR